MIAAAPTRAEAQRSPAETHDLLRSLDDLGRVLPQTLAGGFRLDAFLVSAGMLQILQDELHRDPFRLNESATFLHATGHRLAGRIAYVTGQAVQITRRPFLSRRLRRAERELADLVDELAAMPAPEDDLLRRAAALAGSLERLPGRVRATVLRLPACFYDFDQRPEDVARLARDVAFRYPDRHRRVLVVGVRTSGNYLAPLHAARLRAEGFERVDVVTARPRRRLLGHERRLVQSVVRDGGLVLVVDDPPGTGSALARVIRDLRVPAASVVLVLQLFEGQELPELLAGQAAVCLPWDEWAIHRHLAPPGAKRLPAGRGHARARQGAVLASGTGLGYLGNAAVTIAGALPGWFPAVIDADDGVLRREWLPEEERAADPEAIGEYVAARADALPVVKDASVGVVGEFAAWEVASNVLQRAFGRAGPAVKLFGVDAAARRLLRVNRPSLVDGWTGPDQWFGRTKVGFYERSYWHLGLACFDPLHDLAGAAAGADAGFVAALLRGYGRPVDPERFLLYQLAHLWCRERLAPGEARAARRAQAAAVRRYVHRRFLADLPAPAGPVCALDLDGVLETEHLGFPATTRSGARALRALVQAGYRPVLASGRSATDVTERCADYGLPGGVAEYGGAIVVDGVVTSLLTAEMAAALDRVREQLAGQQLDPLYTHSVRARGLDEAAIERVLADGTVRAVRGESQVDFVPAGIDKASGLAALLAELGADKLSFAVGDTAADLPMLALAERAAAPGHASGALRSVRVRRPYQAGLAEAVEGFLGHACELRLDPCTELLLTILSAQERGTRGMVGAAWRVWRAA